MRLHLFRLLFISIFISVFYISVVFCQTSKSGIVYWNKGNKSEILQKGISYSVYLPYNYVSSTDSFPVLYLLHGYGGDHTSWLTRCAIHKVLDSLITLQQISPFIVVMPDGENSYFINDYQADYRFEDAFITEFIPAIEKLYRVKTDKSKRAIGGLSMGGYGAVMHGIRYPQLFTGCMTYGAAVRTDSMIVKESEKKYNRNFAPLYGDSLLGRDRLNGHWTEYSPFHYINDSIARHMKTVEWYFNCGFNDFLYKGNEALHDLFNEYRIIHEFHIGNGNHSWDYWKQNIAEGLIFVSKVFKE